MNALAELLATSGVPVQRSEAPPPAGGPRIVYMHAGQLIVAAEPLQITTILGRCWPARA